MNSFFYLKVIPLFCTAPLILRITSEMAAFRAGHLKRGNKGCFADNSSRLRRCFFGTRPGPFEENDHFEAEIAPLPPIYHRVAKKRAR